MDILETVNINAQKCDCYAYFMDIFSPQSTNGLHSYFCFHSLNHLSQYNRVWIPDEEQVWKSAEITKDFHSGDSVLELLLEGGTVRKS